MCVCVGGGGGGGGEGREGVVHVQIIACLVNTNVNYLEV